MYLLVGMAPSGPCVWTDGSIPLELHRSTYWASEVAVHLVYKRARRHHARSGTSLVAIRTMILSLLFYTSGAGHVVAIHARRGRRNGAKPYVRAGQHLVDDALTADLLPCGGVPFAPSGDAAVWEVAGHAANGVLDRSESSRVRVPTTIPLSLP